MEKRACRMMVQEKYPVSAGFFLVREQVKNIHRSIGQWGFNT